jgi:transcriptional regulator with XRE-family HTH domain
VSDNEKDVIEFKERLVSARSLRKLSQGDLAAKSGIPQSSISQFEAGLRKPSFDNLRRLAAALSVSTDYLLGRVDTPEQAAQADILFRDAQNLTDANRVLALDFIQMLAKREKNEGK